jgi:hypothetical protein
MRAHIGVLHIAGGRASLQTASIEHLRFVYGPTSVIEGMHIAVGAVLPDHKAAMLVMATLLLRLWSPSTTNVE